MCNSFWVNKNNIIFLIIQILSFHKKKGLIFKESLTKEKVSKQNSFKKTQPWTRSLNNFPAVKAGTRLAGIAIFSPVLGFKPWRAERSRGSKEPNPRMETFLPSTTESIIVSMAASTTRDTSVLVSSVRAATRLTKSALFIGKIVCSRE